MRREATASRYYLIFYVNLLHVRWIISDFLLYRWRRRLLLMGTLKMCAVKAKAIRVLIKLDTTNNLKNASIIWVRGIFWVMNGTPWGAERCTRYRWLNRTPWGAERCTRYRCFQTHTTHLMKIVSWGSFAHQQCISYGNSQAASIGSV